MLPASPDVAALQALQVRVRELEEALGLTTPDFATVFRLPSSLGKLLGLLVSVPMVTPELVENKLGIVSDCKVAVHRLRRYLDMYSEMTGEPELQIRSRRTLGYWMDDNTKERIRALVPTAMAAQ